MKRDLRTVSVQVRLTKREEAVLEKWRLAARPRMARSTYLRRRVFLRAGVIPGLAGRLRKMLVDLRDVRKRVGRERTDLLAIESALEQLYLEALSDLSDLVEDEPDVVSPAALAAEQQRLDIA